MNRKSAYEWLGLDDGASDAQIKKAWMMMLIRNHPDKQKDDESRAHASRITQNINAAKETLMGEREETANGFTREQSGFGGSSAEEENTSWFKAEVRARKAEAAAEAARKVSAEAMAKRDRSEKKLWEYEEKIRIKQARKEEARNEEKRERESIFKKGKISWGKYAKEGLHDPIRSGKVGVPFGKSTHGAPRSGTIQGPEKPMGNILTGIGDPEWNLWTQFSSKLSDITGAQPGGASSNKRIIGITEFDFKTMNTDETGMAWFDFFGGFVKPRNSPILNVLSNDEKKAGRRSPSRQVFDSLEPWSDIAQKPRKPSKTDVCNACGKPFQSPFWSGAIPKLNICNQCDTRGKSEWKTLSIDW